MGRTQGSKRNYAKQILNFCCSEGDLRGREASKESGQGGRVHAVDDPSVRQGVRDAASGQAGAHQEPPGAVETMRPVQPCKDEMESLPIMASLNPNLPYLDQRPDQRSRGRGTARELCLFEALPGAEPVDAGGGGRHGAEAQERRDRGREDPRGDDGTERFCGENIAASYLVKWISDNDADGSQRFINAH